MAAPRTPDRRRWQYSIGSLMVLQVLTAIVMSIFTTFGPTAIVAISLFIFPLGILVLGTILIATNMQEFSNWVSRLDWRHFLIMTASIGISVLILLVVVVVFKR